MAASHPLVALALRAIEVFVREGKQIDPPVDLAPEMKRQAGVFVSLHRYGRLRGCIGTIHPACANVAEEVIRNAISSATKDPRFPPLGRDELEGLQVKVDLLTDSVPVQSLDELDPERYGLIVQSVSQPWKRGLLLPSLEGIKTVEKQVYWTRHHKAGITDPDEEVEMFRFEVLRYT